MSPGSVGSGTNSGPPWPDCIGWGDTPSKSPATLAFPTPTTVTGGEVWTGVARGQGEHTKARRMLAAKWAGHAAQIATKAIQLSSEALASAYMQAICGFVDVAVSDILAAAQDCSSVGMDVSDCADFKRDCELFAAACHRLAWLFYVFEERLVLQCRDALVQEVGMWAAVEVSRCLQHGTLWMRLGRASKPFDLVLDAYKFRSPGVPEGNRPEIERLLLFEADELIKDVERAREVLRRIEER